jgi:hypothetical protein
MNNNTTDTLGVLAAARELGVTTSCVRTGILEGTSQATKHTGCWLTEREGVGGFEAHRHTRSETQPVVVAA